MTLFLLANYPPDAAEGIASGNYSIGNYPFKGQGTWHFSRRKCGNAESVTGKGAEEVCPLR